MTDAALAAPKPVKHDEASPAGVTIARPATSRFDRRRQGVLTAAAKVINRVGLGDTTLALVAAEIGLNLKSLRYYFEKREDLMVAAFLQSIALHRELAAAAMGEPSPEARVKRLVRGYFDMLARVARGEQPAFTYFSDLRALAEPHSLIVYAEYVQFFRAVRRLLRDPARDWDRDELNARTHMLISQLLWSVAWKDSYLPEDAPRVADRFADVLLGGIAAGPVDLRPPAAALERHPATESGVLTQESFLRVATTLINDHGYRGASIERIASALNVSRGAFYHHYEASDELVVACFERTFAVLRAAQSAAMAAGGAAMARVTSTAVDLVTRQMTVEGFMLRTTALTVVGPALRREMARGMSLVTLRFQDLLSDGVADGSVRICDLRIASEMVTAMINSAAELGRWVPGAEPHRVSDLHVRPLLHGLLSGRTGPA